MRLPHGLISTIDLNGVNHWALQMISATMALITISFFKV